jgi:hypothetical protein
MPAGSARSALVFILFTILRWRRTAASAPLGRLVRGD